MKQETQSKIRLLMTGLIILTVVLSSHIVTACSGNSEQSGKLTYQLTTEEDINKDSDFTLKITGKTSNNENIEDSYDAKLNKKYHLNYGEGTYKFTVDVSQLNKDDKIYKVDTKEVKYDGNSTYEVKLEIKLDTEAMAKKKEEADAKAQYEAQKAQQQAQKQAEPTKTYYLVTSTGTFHASESCRAYKRSGTENSSTITGTHSRLEAQGYKACKICFN